MQPITLILPALVSLDQQIVQLEADRSPGITQEKLLTTIINTMLGCSESTQVSYPHNKVPI